MIESIEGKRGLPRHRPPYVAQVGLFGRPTLEQNVETLYWVRDIVEKGAAWFTSQGRRERKGFRSFSVSGRVKKPGVVLAPAGVTARELIEEYCGGMADGHTFKGYLPGGASGGILPASMADVPLDFGTLEKYGCFVGSHAVVILSDKDDMKAVALNLMRFFEDESCGQCTPCRAGTEKAVKLMATGPWDEALLNELSDRDARRLDLRPRPGGAEPAALRVQVFSRRTEQAAGQMVTHELMRRTDTKAGRLRPRQQGRGRRREHRRRQARRRAHRAGRQGRGEGRRQGDHLHARRQGGRRARGRDHLAGRASATAPTSRICATRPSPATGRTAIAAPAWSRSRASACSPQAASARRPPA